MAGFLPWVTLFLIPQIVTGEGTLRRGLHPLPDPQAGRTGELPMGVALRE